LIPPLASRDIVSFEMIHDGPLVAGTRTSLVFRFTANEEGLASGSRLRVGLPNTGWEQPVVPQQRYWDELVKGFERRLAPFHPVNTTASVKSSQKSAHNLDVMERMLVPDEDPAFAYWRWWITFTLEESNLAKGDQVEILYGDRRFGSEGVRIQTFPEPSINISAYVDAGGRDNFLAVAGSPVYFDVVAGRAARANVTVPSVQSGAQVMAKVSLTDDCHAIPEGAGPIHLNIAGQEVICKPGIASTLTIKGTDRVSAFSESGTLWGKSNPSAPIASDGLQLFWGDLHAQSEHHVMHSQTKDFRQEVWSKGISCGTLDECYQYGREVSLLDFVAITDQGACLTKKWEYCQEKVREHHRPGEFIVFKGYEAGSPLGHRNVIYASDEIDPPFDAKRFNNFHPNVVFDYYRGRSDVLIIPHHVKTWTDWSYHDPELEPVMEVYSCWGQSESPGLDLWGKGQTPGAGAWEALRRGYKLGIMASSDNHVGMPGRSYPGDRQDHTPFKGGLCAIWAEGLTRDSLFGAIKARHCYGTTGARILLRFAIDKRPMGAILDDAKAAKWLSFEIQGTDAIHRVEIIHNSSIWKTVIPERRSESFTRTIEIPAAAAGFFYIRVFQNDGERAWSSPIWITESA
jgi:hypothetical protein